MIILRQKEFKAVNRKALARATRLRKIRQQNIVNEAKENPISNLLLKAGNTKKSLKASSLDLLQRVTGNSKYAQKANELRKENTLPKLAKKSTIFINKKAILNLPDFSVIFQNCYFLLFAFSVCAERHRFARLLFLKMRLSPALRPFAPRNTSV